MYLSVDDLNFLIELENELGESENWSERVRRLWELNERLTKQRATQNERIKKFVAERRKENPNYGRSKK